MPKTARFANNRLVFWGSKPHPLRVARFEMGIQTPTQNKTSSFFLLSSSFVQEGNLLAINHQLLRGQYSLHHHLLMV